MDWGPLFWQLFSLRRERRRDREKQRQTDQQDPSI